MTTMNETLTRTDLVRRREDLTRAGRHSGTDLQALVADVDAALTRLDRGTYGICDVCSEFIGTEHLERDPVARTCAEHPTPAEQARIDRDLGLARDVQRALLPKPNGAIAGWQYGYRYEPAAAVGGDFFDVIPIPSRGETLVLVGDVSGKGVAASMLMSHLLATLRSLASLALPTADLLARVNALFHASSAPSSYATLAAASLLPGGAVDLYSAGHWPPMLRRGSSVAPLEVETGLPLGLFAGSTYTPTRVNLQSKDTLLFYTDGAIDAENGAGEDYSHRRLGRALAGADGDGLEALLDRCLQDVRGFQDRRRGDDDLVLMAVRAR
jgi:sigma-B regulation protein RsbU (phosphoserine phosphatase)